MNEEELIDEIKRNAEKWFEENSEKIIEDFLNKNPKIIEQLTNGYKYFKPFDKVLVYINKEWIPAFYSHFTNDKHWIISCYEINPVKDSDILLFEGNESYYMKNIKPE